MINFLGSSVKDVLWGERIREWVKERPGREGTYSVRVGDGEPRSWEEKKWIKLTNFVKD